MLQERYLKTTAGNMATGFKKFEPNDLNKAMMLDLTLLDKKTENKILELYKKYRETAINKLPVDSFLLEINDIFKNKYCQ